MVELTIQNLIKIIIGVLVFVVIVLAISFFFRDHFMEIFRSSDNNIDIILSILK
ncbi:hypothetical protein K0A97_02455 [Patescibacteria group bacterium]|nr:hypothetical protein [Patescibacteria group bacterium]